MNKKICFSIVSLCLLICIGYVFNKISKKSQIVNEPLTINKHSIYVRSCGNEMNILDTTNFNIKPIKHNIDYTLNMAEVQDNKIYAPICNKKWISVFKGGKFQKDIKLKYDLPLKARYNRFNGYTYVSHMTKLTYNDENCITVIDSNTDTEKCNILYDKGVEDITFTKDNKMIVSSWTTSGDTIYNIDIFDLKNNSIVKTLKMPVKYDCIKAVSDDLVYAINRMIKDPYIDIISLSKGKVIDRIKLPYDSPYSIYIDTTNDNNIAYILHAWDMNLEEGQGVTMFNYKTHKIENKIPNIKSSQTMCIKKDKLYFASWAWDKIYVVDKKKFKIEKEIKFEGPNFAI